MDKGSRVRSALSATLLPLKRLWGLVRRKDQPPPVGSRQFGVWGEQQAAEFLRRRGFQILAHNYRCPGVKGEIDLVAQDGEVLVFVEVKTRRSRRVRVAQAAVDGWKRRALRQIAQAYRRRHRLGAVRWRYDVVSVYPGPEIEYFPGAFGEGG